MTAILSNIVCNADMRVRDPAVLQSERGSSAPDADDNDTAQLIRGNASSHLEVDVTIADRHVKFIASIHDIRHSWNTFITSIKDLYCETIASCPL